MHSLRVYKKILAKSKSCVLAPPPLGLITFFSSSVRGNICEATPQYSNMNIQECQAPRHIVPSRLPDKAISSTQTQHDTLFIVDYTYNKQPYSTFSLSMSRGVEAPLPPKMD
mmetsp:Transcript_9481/g.14094  ORF Transcript_9481/g.14094 Transcript_9481/m.14094 type:complete len:112 (-) Transcript_9481:247-582(-)